MTMPPRSELLLTWVTFASLFGALHARPAAAEDPSAWQLTLSPYAAAAVFDVKEDIQLTATVCHVAGTGPDATLAIEVSNDDGLLLLEREVPVSVPPGEVRRVELVLAQAGRLPAEQALSLAVALRADGKEQLALRKHFGILPQRAVTAAAESSAFGLLAEGNWSLVQRLGIRHVRPNWNWNERPMDWAQRYAVNYCPLINEANAYVRGELTQQEYFDFVYESVHRFKGYVKYWQLGNEFDIFHRDGPRAYVEAQKIGYAAAKAADPQCVIVGGSITELQCRQEGWAESLQEGLAQYCDIYDFHFYRDLKTTQQLLDYIHATCKQHSAEKPIWVTETAQVDMFDPDDRNQADYILKRYAHLLANGVSVVMWHCHRWPYPYEADKVAATGIVDYDGFARPALFALAAMTKSLEGAEFARQWPLGEGEYAYEFQRGERSVLVAWSDGEQRTIQITAATGKIGVVFPSGQRSVPSAKSPETRQVLISHRPIIYELPGTIIGLSR